MNQSNQKSAFYPGATRYGGSSAIAKRRVAARRAFFTVKDAPSSSRSTMMNGTSLVHSYTINANDIIRKEPSVPQLSSSANRILSWIEANSVGQPGSSQTFMASSRLSAPKRAFSSKVFLSTARNAPYPQKQRREEEIIREDKAPSFIPKLEYKCVAEVIPPTSSRFRSARYCGPSNEVASFTCMKRKFAESRDLTPKATPKPVDKTESSPVRNQIDQELAIKTPVESSIQPEVSKQQDPLVSSTSSVVTPSSTAPIFTAPTPTFTVSSAAAKLPPVTDAETDMDAVLPHKKKTKTIPTSGTPPNPTLTSLAAFSTQAFAAPAPLSLPKPVSESRLFQSPASSFTLSPKKPSNTPNKDQEKEIVREVNTPFITKLESKRVEEVIPPTSSRFRSARYCGPSNEVASFTCMKRKFAESRDLTPKATPKPVDKTESSPVRNQIDQELAIKTPVESSIQPEVSKQQDPLVSSTSSVVTPSSTAPIFTAPTPTFTVSSAAAKLPPVTDVEMEMDVDLSPNTTTTTSIPASLANPTLTSLATSTATTTPAVIQNSGSMLSPVAPVTALSTQPVFMPPPNFSTPAFTAPVPPPVTTLSMPNGANPFQPSSSIRGRKILRPARRLHR